MEAELASGLRLRGYIDRLDIAPDGRMRIVDYKTGGAPPEEFEARFRGGNRDAASLAGSEPGAYLRARGDAYQSVMSPERFLSLSASIDRHRVDPARVSTPCTRR